MYEEELAYGLGGLLRSKKTEDQLVQGMIGIIADYAHAKRALNLEGRARALLDAFATLQAQEAAPPRPIAPDPAALTDQEYRNRLRTAMYRAGPAVPPPVPEDPYNLTDPDPLRIYTRHAGSR